MKKSLKVIFSLTLALVFSLQLMAITDAAPKKKKEAIKPARFARVAVLPVINLQEDLDYPNTIMFQEALSAFTYPDYEIYDNEKLYKVLDEVNYYEVAKKGITRELLQTILEKSGADMIVAAKLNKLTQEYYPYGREDMEQLDIDFEIKTLYSWQEKIGVASMKEKQRMEYAAIMKTDWKLQEYGKAVRVFLGRIAKQGMK